MNKIDKFTHKKIAEHMLEKFDGIPTIKLHEMQSLVKKEMKLDVSLVQCWRAKGIIVDMLKDNTKDEFAKLWRYVLENRKAHEGNTTLLETNEDHTFKRIYISFDACKRGFLAGCRRVVGFDGAFLKGEMLTAIGRDGNNQMFPIAWAIITVENKDNWFWFLEHLQIVPRIGIGAGWTFISDQCKVFHLCFMLLYCLLFTACTFNVYAYFF